MTCCSKPVTASDLVIADLANEVAALRERLANLECYVRTYRALAVAGFDALREVTLRHDALHADYEQLCHAQRQAREEALLRVGAAA